MTPLMVLVLGPTASGKTSLGIALAQKLDCRVLSIDSRQLYAGMDIGTAKPTRDEQQQAADEVEHRQVPQLVKVPVAAQLPSTCIGCEGTEAELLGREL